MVAVKKAKNLDDLYEMMRLLANSMSSMRGEMLAWFEKADKKIDTVEERLGDKTNKLDIKIDKVEINLTKRIDKIGLQLANLEDGTPTREEFDGLETRVGKVEGIVMPA